MGRLVLITVFSLLSIPGHSQLIASYPFNGNARDESGNGLNGTVFGGATLTEDRFGVPDQAYLFDGTNDYIEVSDSDLLDFDANQDYTISVWVKTAEQKDKGGDNNAIISKWNEFITTGYPYSVWYWNSDATTPNRFLTGRYDSQFCDNNPITSSSTQATLQRWHHIVVTKSGTNLNLYQDNVLVAEIIDDTSSDCGTVNSANLRIGGRETDVRFFTGAIDDINIYSETLSTEDIKDLFTQGCWPHLASYPFNGNALDDTGNGLHGTVFGEAALTEDRFGNAEKAYSFDGVDDYIEILDNDLLDFGVNQDYSISVWVKPDEKQTDLGGNNNAIISKWNELITSSYPYSIWYWNDEEIDTPNRFFTGRYDSQFCNNNPITTSEMQTTVEKWNHIVVTKSNQSINLYQNNTLVANILDNTSEDCGTVNDANLRIGSRETGVQFFTGDIDDIDIFGKALSIEEIDELYSLGGWPFSSEADLLAFSFTEQTGPAVFNSSTQMIEVEVAEGTDISNLIPKFVISDFAAAKVNGKTVVSEQTSLDFTTPVELMVVAEDGTISLWTITVSVDVIHVASYPFNGNAIDETGNGLDGTVFGEAVLTEDRFGNSASAYRFDGVDDYIEVKDDDLLDFAPEEDYSISVWVKPSLIQVDQDGDNNAIISKWNESISDGYPYFIWYWNDNASSMTTERVFTGRYNGNICANNPIGTSSTPINAEWHHVVVVKSGATISLYQDNTLVAEVIDDTSGSCTTINNANLLFGSRLIDGDQNGTVRSFSGVIDDIDIYGKALTVSEIDERFSRNNWPPSVTSTMKSITRQSLFLYPNPAKDIIRLELTHDFVGQVRIRLFDTSGQKVLNEQVMKSQRDFIHGVTITGTKPGLYIMELTGKGFLYKERVLIR